MANEIGFDLLFGDEMDDADVWDDHDFADGTLDYNRSNLRVN